MVCGGDCNGTEFGWEGTCWNDCYRYDVWSDSWDITSGSHIFMPTPFYDSTDAFGLLMSDWGYMIRTRNGIEYEDIANSPIDYSQKMDVQ